MMVILIFVAIYLLSVYAEYKWIQIAYSKGGVYEGHTLEADLATLVMWIPVWNTTWATLDWSLNYPRKKSKLNLNKFFKIK